MKDIKIASINVFNRINISSSRLLLNLKPEMKESVVFCTSAGTEKYSTGLVWNLIFDAINFILVVQSAAEERKKKTFSSSLVSLFMRNQERPISEVKKLLILKQPIKYNKG